MSFWCPGGFLYLDGHLLPKIWEIFWWSYRVLAYSVCSSWVFCLRILLFLSLKSILSSSQSWLKELFIPRISVIFFSEIFHIFVILLFQILCYLLYFIYLLFSNFLSLISEFVEIFRVHLVVSVSSWVFILIHVLFKFIELFLHILFMLIEHSYHNSSEVNKWDSLLHFPPNPLSCYC
jgi:hypothetical protein